MRSVGTDIAVIGAGPAGLALAAACVERGLHVVVVSTSPRAPWHASYAAWQDELPEAAAIPSLAAYAGVRVRVSDDEVRDLDRRYVRIDGVTLQDLLLGRLGSATLVDGAVARLAHDETGVDLHLKDGRTLRAAVAVVAAGAGSTLLEGSGPGTAAQVAWGSWLEVEEHPYPLGRALLMDLTSVGDGPPSFLYALPLGRTRLFVEETVLASRTVTSPEPMRARLSARLRKEGVRVRTELAHERCVIPLDVPLPHLGQRAVGYGAAAGLVHPATGYQVARAIRRAPEVARALASGLSVGPREAAAAAWSTLWPRSARTSRALQLLGLEVLLSLDAPGLGGFFDAFFQLPERSWRTVMDADAGPAALATSMAGLFSHASWPLRRRLADPRALDRALRSLSLVGGAS